VAHRVSDPRQLDLDHIGAEVGELGRSKGAGNHVAGIDDTQAHQRALPGVRGGRAAEGGPLLRPHVLRLRSFRS
jgi:hypothetical protein